jgi:hypothetical protein
VLTLLPPPNFLRRYYREWLEEQQKKITARLIAYDTEQESVLEATLVRLEREKHDGGDDRKTVIEILEVLTRFRQFDAEKVGCEIARHKEPPNTDTALVHLEREAALKRKEQRLQEDVLPKLTTVFTLSHDEQDKDMAQVVVFKKDEEGLTRQAMGQIQAVLKDPPKGRRFLAEDKWKDLFRSQPWLTRQNAEEGRLSDLRRTKRKEMEKQRLFVQNQRKEVDLNEKKVEEDEALILEYLARADGKGARAKQRSRARRSGKVVLICRAHECANQARGRCFRLGDLSEACARTKQEQRRGIASAI